LQVDKQHEGISVLDLHGSTRQLYVSDSSRWLRCTERRLCCLW